jgi:hypothetical protein
LRELKQKSPQQTAPRGPFEFISMIAMCRWFARRVKLFLKRLLNCATRNEIEKARSGYFATGLASSLQ